MLPALFCHIFVTRKKRKGKYPRYSQHVERFPSAGADGNPTRFLRGALTYTIGTMSASCPDISAVSEDLRTKYEFLKIIKRTLDLIASSSSFYCPNIEYLSKKFANKLSNYFVFCSFRSLFRQFLQ